MPRTNKADPFPLIRPRLYLGEGLSIGPGKIDLLRKVGEVGSISAAARALGMPYKRAWFLIAALNKAFQSPVLTTAIGGKNGGGTRVTALGAALIAAYELLERRLNTAAEAELAAILKLVGQTNKRQRRATAAAARQTVKPQRKAR